MKLQGAQPIGPYSFEEFKERAAAFHGYPAPGLLIGGYMVEMARRGLPEGSTLRGCGRDQESASLTPCNS
jgi:formylmethanofuran dehydrogenase subunit E